VARAFVSGARGGIGSAVIAELVASHQVIAQDMRAPEGGPGGSCEWVVGDLLDADVLAEIESRVADRLDVLVVAHGLGGFTSLDRVTPGGIERIMRVNYAAVSALVRGGLAWPACGQRRHHRIGVSGGTSGGAKQQRLLRVQVRRRRLGAEHRPPPRRPGGTAQGALSRMHGHGAPPQRVRDFRARAGQGR
jgi:NAD(P)-dependent dehydrogenase (short-subunit alcohol dehydrogenase family)